MYVLGHELAASMVQFRHPPTWQIATGLEPTVDPDVFFAPSAFILTDCPVLMGHLTSWTFLEKGVPHRIVYWPAQGSRMFDTAALVRNVREIVHQAAELFGRLPYRDYSFLFQDNAYGALEHSNSVTIGIPSTVQSEHPSMFLGEIAHEYFHTWNIIRIHPAEYGDVSYRTPPYSRSLWWSEGLTMFYGDLLVRRAGLPQTDTSRVMHLENLISRYYGNPGNHLIDPEKVSLAAYAPNGMLGDYEASTHLQGELLGAMMDLLIRDRTDGRNSMDDVMREMMVRFSGVRGFTGEDIDSLVTQICHCSMTGFFHDHVRGNKPIDFNTYLRLIGLRADSSWKPVLDSFGKPFPDLRVYPWLKPGEQVIRVGITDPEGCWGKAGLHTGDIVEAVNGIPVRTPSDFWAVLSKIKAGDELTLTLLYPPDTHQRKVLVTGYQQPKIHIARIADPSLKQQRLFDQWNQCK
jgi:predicted metalloprotease with PDZ domain